MVNMSSMHWSLTAPNGLNFTKSIGNPKSRLEKVRSYLWLYGTATKRQILSDVFNRTTRDDPAIKYSNRTYDNQGGRIYRPFVTRGWGSYLFTYGIRQGFFQKFRQGNQVYYCLGPAGLEQLTRRW